MSKPLSTVAVLLSAFILVNALVAGCGGGASKQASESSSSGTSESGGSQMADTSSGGQMAEAGGAAATGEDAKIAAGKKIYFEKCTLCHGEDGKGDGPGAAALNPKPRNHTDGSYMNARTNDELHQVIKNGKGQMPAWGATLSDEQITQVLAYVRTLAVPKYTGPMP